MRQKKHALRSPLYAAVALMLAVSLSSCATIERSVAVRDFAPPVLTLSELDNLSRLIGQAPGPGVGSPIAFARIICGAKGYRAGGANFSGCESAVADAVRDNPAVMVRAQAVASIADQISRPLLGEPAPHGSRGEIRWRLLCYDLRDGLFTACEDI